MLLAGELEGFHAFELLVHALQVFTQNAQLTLQGGAAGIEELGLHRHRLAGTGVVTVFFGNFFGEHERGFVVTLGHQAVFHRPSSNKLPLGDAQLGVGLCRVEAHQHLPFFHRLPFFCINAIHNTAGQVLDGFAVGGHFDASGRGGTGIQRGKGRPQHKAAKADQQHDKADMCRFAGIGIDGGRRICRGIRCIRKRMFKAIEPVHGLTLFR